MLFISKLSWFHSGWSDNRISSFDEILHSRWRAELGGKITPQHQHFSFATYDEVIDVICSDFELKLRRPI
jgi:hypothetical protein